MSQIRYSGHSGPCGPCGHFVDAHGRSVFRVFAPRAHHLAVLLSGSERRIPLQHDDTADHAADWTGYWTGTTDRLPAGTLYLLDLDGRHLPDPASRRQPQGVHGPSMVVDITPVRSPGWAGVKIEDAVVYELHVGSFTPAGTLAAAREKLPHLQHLGINAVELMPLAAFPGERNWGYDGVFPFALHSAYGDHADLQAFIEAAHGQGIAVLLDVVFNHFGPEGNHSNAFAPYTRAAATPWGAAVNFDGEYSHGVRAFFLENTRYWLQDVGFDGLRMDAAAMVFDTMPVHVLREITDLARAIGSAEGRELLMIAEHLRNDRFVTATPGFGYHAQWNDDLHHTVFAFLSGETTGRCINFGAFDDVVKALQSGFVLDGTRFDRYHRCFPGTDGGLTRPQEHVVHMQNHDVVGNRLLGDRMFSSCGPEKALLAITAVFASPFVPMLFMGEEYGETAPFLFFEDFSEQVVIDGAREGRKADHAFEGAEPLDPHARATFVASKLQWQLAETDAGRTTLAYYKQLIALKRAGLLGPRSFADVQVMADTTAQLIRVQTPHTLTVLNFSDRPQAFAADPDWVPLASSVAAGKGDGIAAYAALILGRHPRQGIDPAG